MTPEEKVRQRTERIKETFRNSKEVENVILINCPRCSEKIEFKKGKIGRIVGTIAGGGIGAGLASGLGIAGAILSAPIAIPATLVGAGFFALLGNKFGKDFDNSKPKCKNKIVL